MPRVCLHFFLLGCLLLGCTELVITRRFGVLPFPFPLCPLLTPSGDSLPPHTLSGSSNYANESKRRPSASRWLRWRVCRTGTRKLAGHILKSAADAPAGGGLLTDEGNLPIQGADAASAHHSCRSSGHTSIPTPPPTPAPRLPALHVWLTS